MEPILTPQKLAELKQFHRNTKDKDLCYRINAVYLLGLGYTLKDVARALMCSESTVGRYWKTYFENGLAALLTLNYHGDPSNLSPEQEKQFCEYLDSHLIGTAAEACAVVKNLFNIDYKPESMVQTLHRLNYNYKKTKIRPAKADADAQKAFVEKYDELKSNLKEHEKIYFMDGVHPTHNVMPAYAWIKKGEEREVKSNTGRQRVNINGVYSPQDHEVITIESPTINAQSTIELLQKIETAHPELDKIYIIRDNAKYYNNKLVKEYLVTSKIVMVPLPTYSPNLNLIERLWKLVKKRVMANRYYGTFDEFRGALNGFLGQISGKTDELATLMTENFHIFQGEILPQE